MFLCLCCRNANICRHVCMFFLNLHILEGRRLQGYNMCFVDYPLIFGSSLRNIEPSWQDH